MQINIVTANLINIYTNIDFLILQVLHSFSPSLTILSMPTNYNSILKLHLTGARIKMILFFI